MPDWLRLMMAEAVGTFFLVFPGVAAPVLASVTHHPVPLLDVAVANGIGLGVGISATLAISGGALNPAVAIGLWSLGKLRTGLTVLYIPGGHPQSMVLEPATRIALPGALWCRPALFQNPLPDVVLHGSAPFTQSIHSPSLRSPWIRSPPRPVRPRSVLPSDPSTSIRSPRSTRRPIRPVRDDDMCPRRGRYQRGRVFGGPGAGAPTLGSPRAGIVREGIDGSGTREQLPEDVRA